VQSKKAAGEVLPPSKPAPALGLRAGNDLVFTLGTSETAFASLRAVGDLTVFGGVALTDGVFVG